MSMRSRFGTGLKTGMATLLLLSIASCATIRANMLLISETAPRLKAELLFSDGLDRYNNDLLKKNDLTQISFVRTRFDDTLALDPEHPQAAHYRKEVDNFRDRQYATWLASAQALRDKAKRSAAQDYDLVLAVKTLKDLAAFNKDVASLGKATKALRSQVISTLKERTLASEEKMKAEQSAASRLVSIKDTEYLALSLQRIDPGNAVARAALKEATRLRVDLPILASVASPAPAAAKPAPSAPATAKPASSAPAKAKTRDYDAEIGTILTTVEARINKSDLAGAQDVIRTYLPLLKKQETRTRLSAKEEAIKSAAGRLYAEGIDLYNQEDYEGAFMNFTAIVSWNARYGDSQDYLERVNAKLRALSGR